MPVAAPELAQQFERALGQGHVTVAVAFARPDVEEHPLGIDVADFQVDGFAQAQATGVDRCQGDPMVQRGNPGDNCAHLGGREDNWQLELGCGAHKLQFRRPGPLEGFLPEELDGTQSLRGGLAGQVPLGLEMDEILAEFLGADQVGRALKVIGELAHTDPVDLLASGLERQQNQVIGKAVQDCVRRTFFICIAAVQINVDGLPCVSAWRTVISLWESRP